jgi:hypothetical protein
MLPPYPTSGKEEHEPASRRLWPVWRRLLLVVAIVWAVAGIFFLLKWRDSASAERIRNARACSADEEFTTAPCRATLNATSVSLTDQTIEFDIDGTRMSMKTLVSGDLSNYRAGTPIHVTFYAGKPIRVDGPSLHIDEPDSPARTAYDNLNRGFFFLIGAPILATAGILTHHLRNRS